MTIHNRSLHSLAKFASKDCDGAHPSTPIHLPSGSTLPQVPHQNIKRQSGSAAWDKCNANLTQIQLEKLEIAFNTWDEPIFNESLLASFEDTLSSSSSLDAVHLKESNSFEDTPSSSSSSLQSLTASMDAVPLEESNSFEDTPWMNKL